MQNRTLLYPGTLKRVDLDGSTFDYAGYGFADRIVSSGYIGPRPHPLVPHSFNYEVNQVALMYQGFADYYHNQMFMGKQLWGAGVALNLTQPFAWNPRGIDTSSLYDQLLDRMTARVRGDVDVSVDLAEAHQTKSMLNLLANAERLASTVKKKFGPLKLASDAWLQFTYGWKPLAGSIYGTARQLLEKSFVSPFRDFSVTASRKQDTPYCDITDIFGNVVICQAGGQYRMKGKMSLHLSSQTGIQELSNFTSLNPVSIAWELMPYSFVVDWALDIGGYLRNAETALIQGSSFLSGYWSQSEVYDTTLNHSDSYSVQVSPNDLFVGANRHEGNIRFRRYSRSVMGSYPFPSVPSLKVQMGASRIISAAALLAQHIK